MIHGDEGGPAPTIYGDLRGFHRERSPGPSGPRIGCEALTTLKIHRASRLDAYRAPKGPVQPPPHVSHELARHKLLLKRCERPNFGPALVPVRSVRALPWGCEVSPTSGRRYSPPALRPIPRRVR